MNDRTIGRAGFLGILGAGALGLFFARDVTGLLGRAVPNSVSAIVPTGGWRIYTVGSSMPNIAPGGLPPPRRRPRRRAQDLHARRPQGDAAGRAGLRLPLRHRLGREERPLGRRPDRRRARAGRRKSGVSALRFVSAEVPYEDSLTLQQALLPDVMLAYEMDGKPLSRPHGAPVRLVIPDMYGYKSVKWVNHIELGKTLQTGYWEQNGYDVDAWLGRSNGY